MSNEVFRTKMCHFFFSFYNEAPKCIRLATTYPELFVAFLFGGSGTGIVGPVIAREPGGFLDISTSALVGSIPPTTCEEHLPVFFFFFGENGLFHPLKGKIW